MRIRDQTTTLKLAKLPIYSFYSLIIGTTHAFIIQTCSLCAIGWTRHKKKFLFGCSDFEPRPLGVCLASLSTVCISSLWPHLFSEIFSSMKVPPYIGSIILLRVLDFYWIFLPMMDFRIVLQDIPDDHRECSKQKKIIVSGKCNNLLIFASKEEEIMFLTLVCVWHEASFPK